MIVAPIIIQLVCYALFSYTLYKKQREACLYDLGFIFASMYNLYAAMCFLNLYSNGFAPLITDNDITKISGVGYNEQSIIDHFIRILIYIVFFQFFYVKFGGNIIENKILKMKESKIQERIIIVILVLLTYFIYKNSEKGQAYSDVYNQFDGLSLGMKALVQIFLGGRQALIIILFLYLYSTKRSLYVIITCMTLIIGYDLWFYQGSRIHAAYVVMINFALYNIYIRKIKIYYLISILTLVILISSSVEAFRSNDFNIDDSLSYLQENGLVFSYEFGSLFDSSYHLYKLRETNSLNGTLMLVFNDFRSLIPFIDHTIYSPVHWYSREFYPNSDVPPVTMGPLAESAINFGEFELPIRAIIIAFLYASVKKYFVKNDKLFAYILYLFIFATIPYGFKQTILYQFVTFIKDIALTTMIFISLKKLYKQNEAASYRF